MTNNQTCSNCDGNHARADCPIIKGALRSARIQIEQDKKLRQKAKQGERESERRAEQRFEDTYGGFEA